MVQCKMCCHIKKIEHIHNTSLVYCPISKTEISILAIDSNTDIICNYYKDLIENILEKNK